MSTAKREFCRIDSAGSVVNSGVSSLYDGMKFPAKLTKLIESRGKNQSRLMRETGISQSAISEMTLGKRRPYMDQALLLAKALEVPLDYLADDGQDDPPKIDLSEEERSVVKLYRALHLGEAEALRRLATPIKDGEAAAPAGDQPKRRIIAVRDLTDYGPSNRGKKSVGPHRDDKGSNAKDPPGRLK